MESPGWHELLKVHLLRGYLKNEVNSNSYITLKGLVFVGKIIKNGGANLFKEIKN